MLLFLKRLCNYRIIIEIVNIEVLHTDVFIQSLS